MPVKQLPARMLSIGDRVEFWPIDKMHTRRVYTIANVSDIGNDMLEIEFTSKGISYIHNVWTLCLIKKHI